MQREKDCEPYLRSVEIIKILQGSDTRLQTKVFECLQGLKSDLHNAIVLKHKAVKDEVLLGHAEDAHSETVVIFFKNVQNNIFKSDTKDCFPYFKTIFKRIYFNKYWKEVKDKMNLTEYSKNGNFTKSENEGEKKMFKNDFISLRIKTIINSMSEDDKKVFQMKYENELKRKEIAEALQIQPGAVNTKNERFLNRFIEKWGNKFITNDGCY